MLPRSAILLVVGLSACRVGFNTVDDSDASVVEADSGFDAGDGGEPSDTGLTDEDSSDSGDLDSGTADAGESQDTGDVGSDSGVGDAQTMDSQSLCPAPTSDTVALYEFETTTSTRIADSSGTHSGFVRSNFAGGNLSYVPGPSGCGTAVTGFDAEEAHISIADHSDWQLDIGAIEMWLKLDAPHSGISEGIIGRDQVGNDTGHFSIFRTCGGKLAVRFQRPKSDGIRCTDAPVAVGTWMHLGVNFGSPDLEAFVDGIQLTSTQTISIGSECQHLSLRPRRMAGRNLRQHNANHHRRR